MRGDRLRFDEVFLGIRRADIFEYIRTLCLVYKIDTIMKKRRLKQSEAARLFGVKQPDVSNMLRGEFRQFSVEGLMRFLVALDQNVAIVVTRRQGKRDTPAVRVA